jgi:hypothetical protein
VRREKREDNLERTSPEEITTERSEVEREEEEEELETDSFIL